MTNFIRIFLAKRLQVFSRYLRESTGRAHLGLDASSNEVPTREGCGCLLGPKKSDGQTKKDTSIDVNFRVATKNLVRILIGGENGS